MYNFLNTTGAPDSASRNRLLGLKSLSFRRRMKGVIWSAKYSVAKLRFDVLNYFL
ncbi:hypothetical protein V3C99_008203 [Haemonchus contortus]